jgi:hypothetical protein
MTTSRTRAGLALAAAVLTLGASAAAAEDEFVPQLATGQLYLECAADGPKVQTGTATLGTKAPASVTTGAGCGKPDDMVFSGTSQETPYTMALAGNVTGNLDSLTVTLYTADAGPGRAPGAKVPLAVRATVGGRSLFGATELTSVAGDVVQSPKARLVEVAPVSTGSTGGVRAYTFTITGIDFLTEVDLARKSGHDIVIDVRDAQPNGVRGNSNGHAWLWGAAEAPSGVVLSPQEPSASVLVADERSTRT